MILFLIEKAITGFTLLTHKRIAHMLTYLLSEGFWDRCLMSKTLNVMGWLSKSREGERLQRIRCSILLMLWFYHTTQQNQKIGVVRVV